VGNKLLESAFARSPHMVGRKIGGEYVLVPLVSHGADLDSIFALNRVAAFIWEHLDGKRTGTQIAKALTRQFDVEEHGATQDYCDFLRQLQSIQAVEETEQAR
jgi:hypothetical protein